MTFILTRGGHTFEALSIVGALESLCDLSFIITRDNFLALDKIKKDIRYRMISPSFSSIKTKRFKEIIVDILLFPVAVIESLIAIRALGCDAVVGVGSGAVFAPILAAKLLGRKAFFFESACRIKSRSVCGDIVYRFFADLFFVQWHEQLKVYPKAVYAGRTF